MEPSGYQLKFLIVENINVEAQQIHKRLLSQGYGVTGIVASGEEALVSVEKEKPDIVIMDIDLDGEFDGIVTARKMYQRWKLPIIYLTVKTDERDYYLAKSDIVAEYLAKPFSMVNLLNSIDHLKDRLSRESIVNDKNIYIKRSKGGYIVIEIDEILFLKADKTTTVLHCTKQCVRSLKSLAHFQEILAKFQQFQRCHQSYMINLEKVSNLHEIRSNKKTKLEFHVFEGSESKTIPVGGTYKERILNLLLQA